MRAESIWFNGRLIPWGEATVSVLAHPMQRGSLVFDVLSFRGTPRGPAIFRLRDHVRRFEQSAKLVGLHLTFDTATLEQATCEAVRARAIASGLVRLSAYFPDAELDVVPRDATASVAIAAYELADMLPDGATPRPRPDRYRVTIPGGARKAGPEVFPPEAKVAAAYLGPMLARRQALAEGYDEIVLRDGEGDVAEAPTANVFAVVRGALHTPPLGRILAGITRDSVLALARAMGIDAREGSITPDALAAADEAFLTSTSTPLQPIVSIDGRAVGSGEIGPVTARLGERFRAVERGDDAGEFASWLTYV